MSSFLCEHCNTPILDSEHGYITECEHWPFENIGRKNESNNNTTISNADVEQSFSHEPLGTEKTPRFTALVNIRIISHRKLNHDPDGISAKAVLDGIVRAGILADDSTKQVKKVSFESVISKEEKTIIEIETVDGE